MAITSITQPMMVVDYHSEIADAIALSPDPFTQIYCKETQQIYTNNNGTQENMNPKIILSTTPPTTPQAGMIWIDIS